MLLAIFLFNQLCQDRKGQNQNANQYPHNYASLQVFQIAKVIRI